MAFTPSILITLVFAASALAGVAFFVWRNARDAGAVLHAAIAGHRARDGIVVQDERGRILWANPAYCELMGRTEDEILGRNPLSFCLPERDTPTATDIAAFRYHDDNPVFSGLGAAGRTLYRNRHSSGRLFWNRITLSFHTDRRNRAWAVLVCRDVTVEIETKEELERKTLSLQRSALYDPLTDAANRTHLEDYVNRLIAQDDTRGNGLALIHLDLDRFKDINDRYGHAAGDAALLHATQMANSVLRGDDLLARIGGDEFAIACVGVTDKEALRTLAEKIARAVRDPLEWNGQQILCCTSVGAAFYDGPGDSFERMLGRADMALYEVKRTGRGETALFNRRLASSQERRSHWTDALRKTIDNGHLKFRFQPVIDLANGTIHSIEAQPFWKQPDGSLLRPEGVCAGRTPWPQTLDRHSDHQGRNPFAKGRCRHPALKISAAALPLRPAASTARTCQRHAPFHRERRCGGRTDHPRTRHLVARRVKVLPLPDRKSFRSLCIGPARYRRSFLRQFRWAKAPERHRAGRNQARPRGRPVV